MPRGTERSERVVFLLVDGISSATLEALLEAGRLPTMQRMRQEGGYHGNVVASFPTVSGPAHVPLLTGIMPARIDLIGHNQFVRKEGKLENYLLHYRLLDAKLADQPSVYTNYKSSVSVGEPVRVGATSYRKNLFSLADWAKLHGPANDYVLGRVASEYRHGRDLIVAWLHETDALAHRSPRQENVSESLVRLDRWLGRFMRDLDDRTRIVITSDHGMEYTDRKQFKVHPALREAGLAKDEYRFFLDGGAFCQVYLKTDGAYAKRQDEHRVGEVARALTVHPEIDLILYRRSVPTGFVAVIQNGKGRATVSKTGELYSYRIEAGRDPLGYLQGPGGTSIESGLPTEECHLITGHTTYPDAYFQIYELLAAESSGDLILTAATGKSFNNLTRYAVHGGLQRGQSVTFALTNRPFGRTQKCMRTSDLPRVLGMLD